MTNKRPLFESFGAEWEFYSIQLIQHITYAQYDEIIKDFKIKGINKEIYDEFTGNSIYEIIPHPFGIIIKIFLNKKEDKYEITTKSSATHILEQIYTRNDNIIYKETIKDKENDREILTKKNNLENIRKDSLIKLLEKHIIKIIKNDSLVQYYENRVINNNKKSFKLQTIHKTQLNLDFDLEIIIKIPLLSYDEIEPLKKNMEKEINNFLKGIGKEISFITIFHSHNLD